MVHEALSSTIPTTTIKHGDETCVSSSRSQQDLQGRCVHHHWWMKNKNPRCMLPRLIIVKISVLHPSDYSSNHSEDPCLLCNDMSPKSIRLGNLWKTRIILYQTTGSQHSSGTISSQQTWNQYLMEKLLRLLWFQVSHSEYTTWHISILRGFLLQDSSILSLACTNSSWDSAM